MRARSSARCAACLRAAGQRQVLGRPDLAVGVRVAAAHHRALVLEHLHVGRSAAARPAPRLVGPGVDHARGSRRASISASVRSWRGEKQSTRQTPALGLAREAARRRRSRAPPCRGSERGEVVVEGERGRVGGIALAVGARVAGAEVAGRVVGEPRLAVAGSDLALPGPLEPVRRDEHPLVERAGCSGGEASSVRPRAVG